LIKRSFNKIPFKKPSLIERSVKDKAEFYDLQIFFSKICPARGKALQMCDLRFEIDDHPRRHKALQMCDLRFVICDLPRRG